MKFLSIFSFALICVLPAMTFAAQCNGDASGTSCEQPPMTADFLLSHMNAHEQRDFSLFRNIRPVDLAELSLKPEEFPKIGSALKKLFRDMRTDISLFDPTLYIKDAHYANAYAASTIEHVIQSALHGKQTECEASKGFIHPELIRLFFECLYSSQLIMVGSNLILYMFLHFGVGPYHLQDDAQFFLPPREMRRVVKAFAAPFTSKRDFGLDSGLELSALLWSNLKTEEARDRFLNALGEIACESTVVTMAEVKLILSGRPNTSEPLPSTSLRLMMAFYNPDPYMLYNAGTPVEVVVADDVLTIMSRASALSNTDFVSGPILFRKSVRQITLDDIAELERQGFRCEKYAAVMGPIMDLLNRATSS